MESLVQPHRLHACILLMYENNYFNVNESVYADFRRASERLDRPISELIREAMEQYRRERLQPRRDRWAEC